MKEVCVILYSDWNLHKKKVNSTEFSKFKTMKSKPLPSLPNNIFNVDKVAYKQNKGFLGES